MRPRSTAMRSLYVVPEVAKGVRTPSTSTTRPPAPVLNARATLRPAEVAARESMVKRAYSQSDNIHRVGLRRCVSVQCEVPQYRACSPCASQSQPFALLKSQTRCKEVRNQSGSYTRLPAIASFALSRPESASDRTCPQCCW